MLISANIWRALIEAGITAVPVDASQVELRHGERRSTVPVLAFSVPLNPSDLGRFPGWRTQPVLLIVPSASAAVQALLEEAGWSWLVDDDHQVRGVIHIAGYRVELGHGKKGRSGGPGARQRRPGRLPWGAFALLRRLVERPFSSQRQLAELAGISQPRVSQTLRMLTDHGLVERDAAGWRVRDFDEATRWWLAEYPGPGGLRTFWYGLDSPVSQARAVIELADPATGWPDSAHIRPSAVVSGDVAADFIAPWRNPGRAIVYTRAGLDLAAAGFVPALQEDSTLEYVIPEDPGVWPPAVTDLGPPAGSLPLADPMQILWDMCRVPGPDTDEAVTRLWEALRSRSRLANRKDAA
ncbi:winged helix-turn-helix transcriptional regulator [Plantactinospora sp. B24E8]|uniref:MarR family transcriptional regulator n=1 Tax=Plantactinospora sp. B24E8 TaxID=3153567 RepID=UPI00325CAE72